MNYTSGHMLCSFELHQNKKYCCCCAKDRNKLPDYFRLRINIKVNHLYIRRSFLLARCSVARLVSFRSCCFLKFLNLVFLGWEMFYYADSCCLRHLQGKIYRLNKCNVCGLCDKHLQCDVQLKGMKPGHSDLWHTSFIIYLAFIF